jgi:hypothetical protein
MSRSTSRALFAASLAAATLAGCYVVPVAPDGTPIHGAAVAVPVTPAPVYAPPAPSVLQARMYPANEAATQAGMLSGTVTNMMTGKGRFHLQYQGETLVGEATRVPGDERAGVASAYGQRGTYMNCSYRMTTPYQGTGTCTMSTGATYSVHLGA